VDGDDVVHPTAPAERGARLDGELRDVGGQDLFLVAVRLDLEELPRRHRHDPDRPPAFHQLLACGEAHRDLRARADQHELGAGQGGGGWAWRRGYAPRGTPSGACSAVPSSTGIFWRVSTSAVGPPSLSRWTRQACAHSLASAGRITRIFGIARNDASCSTGWW